MNLTQIHLFNNIELEAIESLLSQLHYQRKTYYKSDYIMQKGTICNSLKIIYKGTAHAEMRHTNDKVIKIADFKNGDSLAVAFLFGRNNHIPVDVIANEATEVLVFPKETVRKMLTINGQFQNNFLDAISNQTQYLTKKIEFLQFSTIRDKYLHFLNEQSEIQKSKTIRFKFTQKQLSELFGVTRPALARVIKELEEEGLINPISPKEVHLLY